MSLKGARLASLRDKHENLDEEVLPESPRKVEEEKIKSSKKPSPKKLKEIKRY